MKQPITQPNVTNEENSSVTLDVKKSTRRHSRLPADQRKYDNKSNILYRPDYYSNQYTIPKFPGIFLQLINLIHHCLINLSVAYSHLL